uniref:Uncharacterized protein n=1 Tax=Arundo donax TaxID=35708 RepID=A0A0A9DHB0_ARUDO
MKTGHLAGRQLDCYIFHKVQHYIIWIITRCSKFWIKCIYTYELNNII